MAERALRLMSHAAAQGTRAMRAHADVAPAYGLSGIEGVAEAAGKLAGIEDSGMSDTRTHGGYRTGGLWPAAAAG